MSKIPMYNQNPEQPSRRFQEQEVAYQYADPVEQRQIADPDRFENHPPAEAKRTERSPWRHNDNPHPDFEDRPRAISPEIQIKVQKSAPAQQVWQPREMTRKQSPSKYNEERLNEPIDNAQRDPRMNLRQKNDYING